MITQGLLYHDFPDDQDNGRKSLVVPATIRNPFTAEGWAKWAVLGACGALRELLEAGGQGDEGRESEAEEGDEDEAGNLRDDGGSGGGAWFDEVGEAMWREMKERLLELQTVSRPLQTG